MCIVKKTKKAFTLAEVLIVLGIIGVVAMITIPNIIVSIEKDYTLGVLKTTYAQLNQALLASQVDNGTDVSNWPIPTSSNDAASEYFANNYLIPYIKTIHSCATSNDSECNYKIKFRDYQNSGDYHIMGETGSRAYILPSGVIISVGIWAIGGDTISHVRTGIAIDINGKKEPNIYGRDVFYAELGLPLSSDNIRAKFLPYGYYLPRDKLVAGGSYAGDPGCCSKDSGSGYYCFAILFKDGWKFSNDYPW